jgi:hypothetical protein
MSDQYTRISCGGSPLDKDAPVVGLLFGAKDDDNVVQIRDADDIPTEISEASTLQVDLHRAVFPQHSVVGWYRVSQSDEEPTPSDLHITQQLKENYAPASPFCFCLLQVEDTTTTTTTSNDNDNDKKVPATDDTPGSTTNSTSSSSSSTLNQELPINLYELHDVETMTILLGLSNWHLETSDPERIAVERVMKSSNDDSNGSNKQYVTHTQSVQQSLTSMKERIQLLIRFLEETQQGTIPPNFSLLRQVQGLMYSLGPLGTAAGTTSDQEDAELLSHLAAVAKTVSAVQSYTDKFRVMHENRTMSKETRRAF